MEAYMNDRVRRRPESTAGSTHAEHQFPFYGLPSELQILVVHHLPVSDLLNFQRSSKAGCVLASAKAWNRLVLNIESSSSGSAYSNAPDAKFMPILQTLVCSENQYARYVHEFALCAQGPGRVSSKQFQLFKIRYAAGGSAQQSLNINLLAMLQRARKLQTFFLNAPLELSESVWQCLSGNRSLLKLDVTLDGRQAYVSDRRTLQLLTPDMYAPLPAHGHSYRKLEHFSNLRTLSLRNLNELDHLDQIAACLRSCATTLVHLQLSFSEQLFDKARKPNTSSASYVGAVPPPPPIDEFDMEEDDDESYISDEDILPPPDPGAAQVDNESIRKNKAEQDSALARIFSVNTDQADKKVEKSLANSAKSSLKQTPAPLDEEVVSRMPDLINKLMKGGKMDKSELDIMDKLRSQIDEAFRSNKRTKIAAKASADSAKAKAKVKKNSAFIEPSALASLSAPSAVNVSNPFAQITQSLPKTYVPPLGGPSASSTYPPQHPGPLDNFGFDSYMLEATQQHADQLASPPHPIQSWPVSNPQKNLSQIIGKYKKLPSPHQAASSTTASETDPSASTSSPSIQPDSSVKDAVTPYEDMNIDLEHPDEISGESGDDQESADEEVEGNEEERRGSASYQSTKSDVRDKGEGKGKGKGRESVTLASRSASPTKRSLTQTAAAAEKGEGEAETTTKKELTADEIMRDWLRRNDGFALENLKLFGIPLKASVLGRALRLHCLTEVVLLSVGGQGPFWQMLDRAHEESPLALTRIQTDDVSRAFLDCISKLKGVSTLILRRRAKKDKYCTTTKEPATIDEICRYAVQPHVATLGTLAIQNDQDASWCLTQELISLLCSRAKKLSSFAFQAGATRYCELMRLSKTPDVLPSLKAIYFISSGIDPAASVPNFSLVVPPPPPPPLSPSSEGLAPNGEAFDISHGNFVNDRYVTCISMTKDWATTRHELGDKRLRIVAVHSAFFKIVSAKKTAAKSPPAWLRYEYDALGKEVRDEKSFKEWMAENTAKFTESPPITFKSARGQALADGLIFTEQVAGAKIS